MEPNKLEQEIREKLSGRTINPSPMAWDRLDAMLTVAEGGKPTKKRNRAWMYMAACFLLMLSVGGYLLLQDSNSGNGLVNENTKENNTNTTIAAPPLQPQAPYSATAAVANAQQGLPSSSSKNNHKRNAATKRQEDIAFEVQAAVLAEQPSTLTEPVPKTVTTQKVKVDAGALLASVQTKKPQAAKATQPMVKVDANAMLMGIDGDMETNFRDRMLNKLVKGYDEVKEAVVTRNHN